MVGSKVTVEVTGMLTDGRALDDDAALDDIPPATLTLALRRPIGTRGFAQLRGAFFAADSQPGPTEVRMPGTPSSTSSAACRWAKQLDLNVTLRNLLDRDLSVEPRRARHAGPGRLGRADRRRALLIPSPCGGPSGAKSLPREITPGVISRRGLPEKSLPE